MNFSLSFYSENERINFKTAYTIVIGKELGGKGGGGETRVILRIGSLSYVIECAERLRANYLNRVKSAFNKTAF